MKRTIIAALVTFASFGSAHAASFFEIEAGLGAAQIKDMGDGTWIQQGAPNNHERKTTPAVMVGFTGQLVQRGAWDLRYHADYVYIGQFSAAVDGVPDAAYDVKTHKVLGSFSASGQRYSPFNGQGHVQGVPLTLDVGYTYNGWRVGVEGGAWVYWQTWHESLYNLNNEWQDLSHNTVAQVGYVVGANITHGNLGLSYRYYGMSAKWNPQPGLATGAHVLMATYRF